MLKTGSLPKSGMPRAITLTVLALATVKPMPGWVMLIVWPFWTSLKIHGAAHQLWHRKAEFDGALGKTGIGRLSCWSSNQNPVV